MPKAIGIKNVPLNEPVLYVYNHVTRRGEPLFLALAAPSAQPIRFLAEITVLGDYLIERTRRDVVNSVFPASFQARMRRHLISRFLFEKVIDLLTRYFITQMGRFNVIPVYLHDPATNEERIVKRRVNRRALEECVASLEQNVPVAIAPSGGSTHEEAEDSATQTVVPTLASFLYRRGKTIKIIPCVIKENPPITKQTYGRYLADRMIFLRFFKQVISRLKGKRYERPRVTVEFLPPLVFPKSYPTKMDKLSFVHHLRLNLGIGSRHLIDFK
ncbi:MAG: hypothetical protein ACUVV5_03185 [Candidatus Aminicenantales bacterium]